MKDLRSYCPVCGHGHNQEKTNKTTRENGTHYPILIIEQIYLEEIDWLIDNLKELIEKTCTCEVKNKYRLELRVYPKDNTITITLICKKCRRWMTMGVDDQISFQKENLLEK